MSESIRWYKRAAASRPFVVLTGWAWAKPHQVQKHVELYDSVGWDTLAFYPSVISLWLPNLATSNAELLLTTIANDLATHGDRPFVFANFSGAPKVTPENWVFARHDGLMIGGDHHLALQTCYYKLLSIVMGHVVTKKLSADQLSKVKRCAVGQLYDSSPVDFTSDVVRASLFRQCNQSRTLTRHLARARRWCLAQRLCPCRRSLRLAPILQQVSLPPLITAIPITARFLPYPPAPVPVVTNPGCVTRQG
jgi:hypothetical protein